MRFEGHVGRCLITSRDPDTGTVDLPTLDILREYRTEVEYAPSRCRSGSTGGCSSPAVIRIGDPVVVER